MRITTILAVLSLVLILSGCGPVASQNSMFKGNDLTFDPGLIGTWASHDDGVITFRRLRGQFYKGAYRETPDATPITLDARLGDLEGLRFLDVTFVSGKARGNHWFFRFWRVANVLQLAGLDSDWVEKMLISGKVKLDYQRVENEIVLTAPTDDLHRFIVNYAQENEAFPDVMKFLRQR